jgi:hypothetical protein
MKVIVKNSLWILLVAAAYLGGTMQRTGRKSPSTAVDSAPGSKTLRPSLHGRSAGTSGGSGVWLDSFRGREFLISDAGMKEAVAAILLESDPVTATRRFTQLLAELSPENAPAILEALRDGGGRAPDFLALLAHAWGQMDGLAAVEAFDSLRGRGAEAAKSAALAAWAAGDPDAAMAWLEEHAPADDPNTDRRARAAWSRGILTGLARRDMSEALEYLMKLSAGERGAYVGVLVDEKLRDGVAAGGNWALQLPDEPLRVTALESVGMKFLRQDLDGAREWAQSLADRADAHELVADVADALATRNPAEAAEWVSKLPAGPSQEHAYEDLFENWSRTDPVAAGQSLTGMDPGPARDTAIQAFSRTLVRQSPEDALVWAGAITDTNQRADVQVELARRWRKSAPDVAAAWVAANLPAELQTRVIPPTP